MPGIELDCTLLAVPVRLRIARARILWSHHVIVTLRDGDRSGLGEGVLYDPRPHRAADLLRSEVLPWALEDGAGARAPRDRTPAGAAATLRRWLPRSTGLMCAVDGALWDLQGRSSGRSVSTLLGGALRDTLPLTEQIFLPEAAPTGDVDATLDAIRRHGTRRVKIKIGAGPRADLDAVRRVRAALGDDVELRVDANRAYRWSDSLPLYRALAEFGVSAFEEPLERGERRGLRELRRALGVPIILDESVPGLADLEAAIEAEAIDLLNVKLARVGGISAALEHIALCNGHDVGVVMGSSEELGIGTAQIAHVAATLDRDDEVEGLGPLRLGFDVADPPWRIEHGAIAVPDGPGLGVALRSDWRDLLPAGARVFDLVEPSLRLWLFSRIAILRQRAENAWVRLARATLP